MKCKYAVYFFVISLVCINCSSAKNNEQKTDSLPATALHTLGRYRFNDDKELELISSAAHFGFSFEGTQCQIFASLSNWQDHNYLQYELDGVYQKRIRISSKSNEPITITASKEGKHAVWIYKATEATTGPIFINHISGNNIGALSIPKLPLIEFIGNSITCGAAADASEVACGTGEYHDQHNAYEAYGPRMARALGVNFILSSVSGIGIYRFWNNDGPNMPDVYEKTDFQNPQRWDFSSFTPNIVSIALGTNDLSNGDGKKQRLPFDSSIFVDRYIDFIKLIRSKYPSAQIALLSSPMMNGNSRLLLQNCLTAIKIKTDSSNPKDIPLALYFFEPMEPHGCSGHPSVEDHAILAKELEPFFKNLLR